MLTVIVAPGDPDRLAGLLAALTPAAVEGLVREVLIAGAGARALVEALCDETGAEPAADVRSAVRQAKSELLLVAAPEWRPLEGWVEKLADHLREGGRAAVLPGLGAGLFRRAPEALLVGRADAGSKADVAGLRRVLGPRARRLA